jgi:16S rRNA (cytidine1402-2'-O)-methyltransferase
VATPIGNLADLSQRAGAVLGAAALIAAEDTRRCGKLLAHLGIEKKMLSLHEHNEESQTARLIAELERGHDIALVSDAGTPLISDPGLRLVQAAAAAGLTVVGIPGPSAVTLALSVAGLPTDRFVFEGFLPRRASGRRARLAELRTESRTLVFFEAVHRVDASLKDLIEVFGGERRAVLARELSKLHEQVVRGSLSEISASLGQSVPLLGEFVIVVGGAAAPESADDSEIVRIYELLAAELPPSLAVALCARISGRSRNDVYALTRGR